MIEPTQFFKCLSDQTRLHTTLLIYSEGELCVCELMAALNDSQPKISRHLTQLRNCGILNDTRRGQWVFYSLAKTLPEWGRDILSSAHKACANPLDTYKRNLATMKSRPQCC